MVLSSSSSPSSAAAAAPERHSFQAETKQLLHIVANALYTDKHVFLRCVRRDALAGPSLYRARARARPRARKLRYLRAGPRPLVPAGQR